MTDLTTEPLPPVPTTVVNGFFEAGKTSWIQDTIVHDYYHKRGTTLILALEDGEAQYDTELLRNFRTEIAMIPENCDPADFCREAVTRLRPGRVYAEMNAMQPVRLPDCLKRVFTITLVDYSTLSLYFANLRQQLRDVIMPADQVVFRNCPELKLLEAWGDAFRLMNRRASYLWQAPAGYHEKAFGVSVPYDLAQGRLDLTEEDYIPFVLDGMSQPFHYFGKTVSFVCQADIQPECAPGEFRADRMVMACCAADMQRMGFMCRCEAGIQAPPNGAWIRLTARCEAGSAGELCFCAKRIESARMPERPVLSPGQRTGNRNVGI